MMSVSYSQMVQAKVKKHHRDKGRGERILKYNKMIKIVEYIETHRCSPNYSCKLYISLIMSFFKQALSERN